MADVNILSRYGIKEVADVTFYKINENGTPGAPVLYLDTLKVSTIEQTAENTSARGGKGNPELIMWDYGKEITVTLEDALFSAKSMAIMYGAVNEAGEANISTLDGSASTSVVKKTVSSAQFDATGANIDIGPTTIAVSTLGDSLKYYDAEGKEVSDGAVTAGEANFAYATFDLKVAGHEIVISADTFPGTYYVTGDTYARSEVTGQDEFFQFILPKAKVTSEVTLTMEAEGDPSTFSMNLKVLRPKDGKMMKLVKYSLPVAG